MVSISDVEAVLKEKGRLIDKELEKVLPRRQGDNLYEAVWYHIGTGGKRIRPALALMACESLGGEWKRALPLAAACELLHNWLLVHDDIEDGDEMRRDQPTVWKKYGVPHAINVGDLMAHKVFELITGAKDIEEKTRLQLVRMMVETTVRTAEGQAADMNLSRSRSPSEKEYMEMAMMKTGHYMTAPIVGGALIGGAGKKELERILEFGRHAGPAFQIADDILDLTQGKGRGGETARDIKEGKRTIMVVHCLDKCTPGERKAILEILDRPKPEKTREDINFVLAMLERYRSVEYARSKAEELMEKAKKAAKPLPDDLRGLLEMFADYMINRKK
jgi:geranylgeranyl pyrophosphate synthase